MSQVAVNIVYPIDGGTYPILDAECSKIRSAYFTSSFSVTCSGGPHTAKWGFDGNGVGEATFYDQMSAQFVHKLPGGTHIFWVKSDCGEAKVEFKIG